MEVDFVSWDGLSQLVLRLIPREHNPHSRDEDDELEAAISLVHIGFTGKVDPLYFMRENVVGFLDGLKSFVPAHRGEATLVGTYPAWVSLRVYASDMARHAALEIKIDNDLPVGHAWYTNSLHVAFALDPSRWEIILAALQEAVVQP